MRDDRQRREDFRAIYAAESPSVLAYARRRAATGADADDAVAETFLVAWRRYDEMPAGERRRAWLYGVAGRVLANQRRGSARRGRLLERIRSERAECAQIDSQPMDSPIAAAFARLSAGEREVLALAYWEGLDPGEIAVALDCTRNAARIRLHRARRSLERELSLREGADLRARAAPAPIREEGAG